MIMSLGAGFSLTYLLLAAFNLQLECVLQVLLQTLLSLNLLFQKQDLSLQLLLQVISRCPHCHQVFPQLHHQALEFL